LLSFSFGKEGYILLKQQEGAGEELPADNLKQQQLQTPDCRATIRTSAYRKKSLHSIYARWDLFTAKKLWF